MTFRVEFDANGARDMRALDGAIRPRIVAALKKLEHDPRPAGVVAMKGSEAGELRIRIGEYRVIYEVSGDRVLVVRVGHRKDVYRR